MRSSTLSARGLNDTLFCVANTMKVVCIANLVKCACIFHTTTLYATTDPEHAPLSTLGDAAVSFLRDPDISTQGMSLADRASIETLWANKRPNKWTPHKERWYAVSSKATWLGTLAAYVLQAL